MSQEATNLYNQGYRYYTGTDGYPQDDRQALSFFHRAAQLGHSDAMNYMGMLCEDGEGVIKNYVTAVEWFLSALQVNENNRHASYNLARMYYNGFGVQKDLNKAFVYANKAAVVGRQYLDAAYAKSCYLVGVLMIEHYKLYRDAAGYFANAAEHGNIPEAWHNLGWLASRKALPADFYDGTTQAHIDAVANHFYLKAAKLGYLPAMDEVGRLHIVYQDEKTARYWLTKAANEGYEPSRKRLRMLRIAGSLNGTGALSSASSTSRASDAMSRTSSEVSADADPYAHVVFHDMHGNLCKRGSVFYDATGQLCEWGGPFHDFKGNLCVAGGTFYDSRGNLCEWGSPFYDAKGNYIVP